MPNPQPLEQSTLEQTRLPEAESKAALERKIDQAQPAADRSNSVPDKATTDAQQLKAELPEKNYPPTAEAEASLQNRATVDEITAQKEQLDTAAKQAEQHVPEHVASRGGQRVEFYKMRGRIGEELAATDMKGANLNDVTGKSNGCVSFT